MWAEFSERKISSGAGGGRRIPAANRPGWKKWKMEKGYILATAKFDRRLSVRSASASLLVLLSVLIARGQMNNPHATPADRAAGSKIFRSHCASCHGVKGTGGLGPKLITRSGFPRGFEAPPFPPIPERKAGNRPPPGLLLWTPGGAGRGVLCLLHPN